MGRTTRNARSRPDERPTALRRIAPLKLILGTLTLLLASGVLAQSGGGYDLSRWMVAGGGTMFSTGGGYSLGTTAGQAGAGTVQGGSFTIYGGFWQPVGPDATPAPVPSPGPVYLPLVVQMPTPLGNCPDMEPNDIPEQGQPLTTINTSCIGSFQTEPVANFDYYWVRPSSGQHIVVDLTSIPPEANYDISLIREDGPGSYLTVALSANSGQANEHFDYLADSNKRYFIRVRATALSTSAKNTYTLMVAIT
jgi:hypothetical protein